MDNNSLRRSFTLVSGGNPNVAASFRGFNSYPHWGDQTNQSWEDMMTKSLDGNSWNGF